jgi:class 3 adenylate cyclase
MRLSRSRLLPARVSISLANDDVDTARLAAEELEALAAEFQGAAFSAAALTGRGSVELAEGHVEEAIASLDKAWRLWREIDLPYESAQARALLGEARMAAGDEAAAKMELAAARSGYERIGAAADARAVGERLGEDAAVASGSGRRVVRTFMFTDIVTSTDLVGVIGDAAWEDLLGYHDRALRAEFSNRRGQEVRHTGDGFFVAFESAADAIEAAVAIQRRLDAHRREHGFAPWVRIGMHTAEATPKGGDYAGQGVHVAARVGNLGAGEEVVVSADTVAAAGTIRFPLSAPRLETLKGVADPVTVYTVDWRS